ncbi:uncharacterized protein fyb1b isoform X3 [Eucyclogobius newberryi]|uniref:uncharacterized protein fyb1b isoform X3 n=1 Tax=Eucyclogobius newberryi TaxID=166745 RepID=UPI003B5A893E
MENKSDVKSMMARFQANSEDTPSIGPGRLKQPLHHTLSGQTLQMKKPVSESGAAIPPKPFFTKNTPSFNSDTVAPEPNKTKALAGMFANSQEDTNPHFIKQKLPTKPSFTQMSEPKTPPNKPGFKTTGTDAKPTFPKPPVISTKPRVKEDSVSSPPPPAPKIPLAQLKPTNNFFKLQQQMEANGLNKVITDSVNKPILPIPAVKPTLNIKSAQTFLNKEPAEQDTVVRPSAINKLPLNVSNNIPPLRPPPSKKPSLKKVSPHIKDGGPKRNPLTNSLALGPAPAKPNRPPDVNIEVYKSGAETPPDDTKKTIVPPPPPHPSNNVTPMPPPVPSLPPRHPGAINETEEFYDDVDILTSAPPPLPPVHPSQMSKTKDEDDDEDGEMYEDLDERWEAAEQKQERKVKDDKEDKKRIEAEKKEREKKEQEARKKFKLVGPLEVLQKGKARVDFKGSKTELSLKQGDSLDIIRIQGNPEGKWLGRSQDGSIGYVKIASVKIDYNSLKQQTAEQSFEPDVYDDIDMATPDKSHALFSAVALPPLPVGGEEIYDDVDSSVDVSPSEPLQSPLKPRVFHWMLERSRRAPSTKV